MLRGSEVLQIREGVFHTTITVVVKVEKCRCVLLLADFSTFHQKCQSNAKKIPIFKLFPGIVLWPSTDADRAHHDRYRAPPSNENFSLTPKKVFECLKVIKAFV